MEDQIVPLITCHDGSFELCEETLEWLGTLNKPFGIISCAGRFRTGKSFLLNRILDCEPNKGFGVGETVQACTKGLWISKKKINASENLDVLIMDTEGIDSLDAGAEHDTRIFTLSILLSSIFLYNSVGHIDEAAVQTLSFMSKVSEYIDSDVIAPKFFWVLRDFSLQMVDEEGKKISNKEYIEHSLAEAVDNKSSTRGCIKSLFKDRDLFTLPRPSKTDSSQNLNKRLSNVNPKFMSAMAKLRETLLDNSTPICADDKPMSGSMFVKMCRILVEKVKSSQMPVMKDAWSLLREIQHNDVSKNLLDKLEYDLYSWKKDTAKNLQDKADSYNSFYLKLFQTESMKPFQSKTYEDFKQRIIKIMKNEIEAKKIDIQELVQESMKNIIIWDWESVMSSFSNFVTENGEVIACNVWFPVFLKEMRKYNNELGETIYEKGKNEAKESLQTEVNEITSKYEEAMVCLEHEKEEVLKLKSEILTHHEPEPKISCVSIAINTDEYQPEKDAENFVEDEEYEALNTSYEESCANVEFLTNSIETYKQQLSLLKERVANELNELKLEHRNKMMKFESELNDGKLKNENMKRQCLILEERTAKQNDELVKYEQKCLQLQDKFVDLHKQTLEQMRQKDASMRQFNSDATKEILNMNRKAQEEKRLLSISQTETVQLKRQLELYDTLEQEVKRVKREYNETNLDKTRYETDLVNTKSRLSELSKERDSLRKLNMQLENKVAVLETTSLLSSCKKSIIDA